MPNPTFWKGKKVLLTGHTGFKGSWLSLWLTHLGSMVRGVALAPESAPNLFEAARIADSVDHLVCDIRDYPALNAIIENFQPDIVLHLAAQALVRKSYNEPIATFATNVMGTANVLETLRGLASAKVALMVTTDKVYADRGERKAYVEDSPLGGHDPYSASKAASEIVIDSYRKSFLADNGIAVASARAGNVIGGGDWSEDRLIPDAVRAWTSGNVLLIRMPQAVRPWQHVLEPLSGYLSLVELLWNEPQKAGPYNFGPPAENAVTVGTVVELANAAFGKGEFSLGTTMPDLHEAEFLKLDTRKSQQSLPLKKPWTVAETVNETMSWYKDFQKGADAYELCLDAIRRFEELP